MELFICKPGFCGLKKITSLLTTAIRYEILLNNDLDRLVDCAKIEDTCPASLGGVVSVDLYCGSYLLWHTDYFNWNTNNVPL